ncbi:MAG: DUF6506 family protein [Chloroflexi bacterium]|nr:DUF6506 family protein [Chloroflexota bacterium]
MAFKVLFIAHAPDADPKKHKYLLETSMYKLFIRIVKNQAQALEACKNLVKEEGIHSILLCPGFTHKDISEIAGAVGQNVSVSVARGDGPSSKNAVGIMEREGWYSK